MKLIAITTPTFFVEENNIINNLFEEGLDILHLRKPNTEPIFSERLLTLINPKWHGKIVVHDYFYLKSEYNLMGIHLNSRFPDIPENYHGHISRSCHSFEEVKNWKKKCGYVFLSPIFDSISKEGYQSAFTDDSLRSAAIDGVIDKKVIALGGVSLENISKLKEYGFGGVAIHGGLWNKFDFHTSSDYKELVSYFKKLRRITE